MLTAEPPHFSLMTVVAPTQLAIVVTSAGVEPTIIEAEESSTTFSCSVAPKPMTVVVLAVTVMAGGLPWQTTVAIGTGMQVVEAWTATSTVLVTMPAQLLLCATGAQTWKL